jgi:hypothetical protein
MTGISPCRCFITAMLYTYYIFVKTVWTNDSATPTGVFVVYELLRGQNVNLCYHYKITIAQSHSNYNMHCFHCVAAQNKRH